MDDLSPACLFLRLREESKPVALWGRGHTDKSQSFEAESHCCILSLLRLVRISFSIR